jgi:hypothetical protein
MARIITWETKSEGKKTNNPHEPKKGKKLIPLMVGRSYLTHCPSNVICTQIVNLIVVGGLEHTSPTNAIFLFIVEVKAH